jgi:hypothetical protein
MGKPRKFGGVPWWNQILAQDWHGLWAGMSDTRTTSGAVHCSLISVGNIADRLTLEQKQKLYRGLAI